MWRFLLGVFVATAPGFALAQTVKVEAGAARDGGVKTRHLPLIRHTPSRKAYGMVESPSQVLSLRASIIEAAAQLQLAEANLKRTSQLYHAAHNVSVASLEQAQAAQSVAAAKLAALKAKAVARYGSSLGNTLSAPEGPLAGLAAGKVSLIEVSLGAPTLPHPPRQAAARADGKTLPLTLIGAAGSVPAGMVGQGFYYIGPALPSGMPLSITLPQGAPRSGYAIPLSALVYRDRKASMFVETRPGRFLMVPVPMSTEIDTDGGTEGYFVPAKLMPRDAVIAVQGAGFLLSVAAHQKAKAKSSADPDED